MKSIIFSVLLMFGVHTLANDGFKAQILVTDFDEVPIQDITIKFYGEKGEFLGDGLTNYHGQFTIDLEPGSFTMKMFKGDEMVKESSLNIPPLEGRKVYNNVRIQILYEERTTFEIDDLHFETGSSQIQETSYSVLDRLATFILSEGGSTYEIAGHTDAEGSANSNLLLSQKRANAVRDYLIKQGVSADRLIAKGYGETQPIASNDTAEGKAQNRRTELRKQ